MCFNSRRWYANARHSSKSCSIVPPCSQACSDDHSKSRSYSLVVHFRRRWKQLAELRNWQSIPWVEYGWWLTFIAVPLYSHSSLIWPPVTGIFQSQCFLAPIMLNSESVHVLYYYIHRSSSHLPSSFRGVLVSCWFGSSSLTGAPCSSPYTKTIINEEALWTIRVHWNPAISNSVIISDFPRPFRKNPSQ